MKNKKGKKNKKFVQKIPVFVFWVTGSVVLFLALLICLFFYNTPASIYISSENPKQGDTVFIRVKSAASSIAGNFDGEKLFFYRKNDSSEWVSFLGIDADQKPGEYTISVIGSGMEKLTKQIKVSLANFTNTPTVAVSLPGQTAISNAKAISNIRQNDNPAIQKVINKVTLAPYFAQPFSSPLSMIKISGFSFGQFIGLGKTKIQHLGVDLTAPEKTEIYAVNDGKVVATLNLSNYGKTVIIDHGLDIFSMYLHLDKFKVSVGQMVKRGEDIGLSGETGYVSGPHLHFSMRVDGTRVDPIAFIDATQNLNDNFVIADISNAFLNLINQK